MVRTALFVIATVVATSIFGATEALANEPGLVKLRAPKQSTPTKQPTKATKTKRAKQTRAAKRKPVKRKPKAKPAKPKAKAKATSRPRAMP